MKLGVIMAVGAVVLLAGCQNPSQNRYRAAEVGKSSAVSFATVLAVREIDVIGQNSGIGAAAGGAMGGVAGNQFGQSGGNLAATLGGALVGLAVGALAEQAINDRKGLEYTLILESGVTLTVTQELPGADEKMLAVGERVIVQNTGGYQRVLPASNLPTQVKRPQGLKVVD
jgi:outer membrane lipoprotein SlyB